MLNNWIIPFPSGIFVHVVAELASLFTRAYFPHPVFLPVLTDMLWLASPLRRFIVCGLRR